MSNEPPPKILIDHPLDGEVETVRQVLDEAGWTETVSDDWALLWSNELPAKSTYRRLRADQRVNHFPGISPLIRKDALYDHLALAFPDGACGSRRWGFPQTFSVPDELDDLRSVAEAEPEAVWIVKERSGSMGVGMYLAVDPNEIKVDAGFVAQRYIDRPMLFQDHPHKHVMRVYVLVTSMRPLQAYLYPESVIKVTSLPYVSATTSTEDLAVHLTNPTVQVAMGDRSDPIRAIDRDTFAARMAGAGHSPTRLWRDIAQLAADVLGVFAEPVAVVSSMYTRHQASCFSLLGFDVLVDDEARPWLLECNLSPALGTRSSIDSPAGQAQRRAKNGVVRELLTLVGATEAGAHPFLNQGLIERVAGERARRGSFELLVDLDSPTVP